MKEHEIVCRGGGLSLLSHLGECVELYLGLVFIELE